MADIAMFIKVTVDEDDYDTDKEFERLKSQLEGMVVECVAEFELEADVQLMAVEDLDKLQRAASVLSMLGE